MKLRSQAHADNAKSHWSGHLIGCPR